MKLSIKIMNYNFFVRAFIPYVTTAGGIARYGLSTLVVTALTDFLVDWIAKFDAYADPLTNSTATTTDVNEAYLVGFPLTEGVRANIKGNTTITLSGVERIVLNLKKPSNRRGHVLPQKTGPSFICIGNVDGSYTMIASDTLNPRVFGKPDGNDIGLKIAFTKVGDALAGPDDFHRMPDETTAEFELIVSAANNGKLMSLKGTYINARGEEGDDGVVFMMVVNF
jgi:hypothetical protein